MLCFISELCESFVCKEDVRMSFSLINTSLKVILCDCINLQLDDNVGEAVSHIHSPSDSVIGFEFFSRATLILSK